MTKQEMEQYKDKKPVAVYPMSTWGGLEILDIVYGTEDYVICRYNYGEPDKLHKVKIKYGEHNAYIRLDGMIINLNNCVKI